MTSDGLAMVTLSFHEEDLELGKDFFILPHPSNSGEALFMVDGLAKRAMLPPRIMRVFGRPCPKWAMRSPWLLG
jgi:hypothetical protein